MWRSGILLLLLPGLLLLAAAELQQETEPRRLPPPGKLDFGYVPAGLYETLAHYEPGPIGILFQMVHTFLYAVQPNAFPQELIVKLAKDKFGAIQTEYQKAIYYEIGFLVCAAVGLLFAVLIPLAGLFFCMCRCCDNCGGEMHQRQRKNADCQRGLLGTLLFSTSLVITIGVLCAYAANQNLSSQVKNIRRLVNSNMRDLHTFANDTPMQIDYLISQYATAKKKVIYDLNPMRETKEALENVSVSLEVLQEGTGKLNFNLSLLCRNIRQSLSQLQISANFTRLPRVNTQLEKMNEVLRTDLSTIVQRGFSSLNDTPHMVIEQTRSVVESVQSLVDGIGHNISSFSKAFPVQNFLSNFTIFISHTHAKIEDQYPEIDKMDFYRWIGCIGLCCMVVLVLAFNYLGLLCGTLGYDKHASPTTRGCISNTGGTMLMAGVGFSFIFSWVLMGLVTTMFLAGGNLEKLVCDPFHSKELSCKENKGIYLAMRLDKVFNISTFLNTTVFTKDVVSQLESVKIDLRGIILLEAEGKQNLLDFSEAGLSEINYADYLEENKILEVLDAIEAAQQLISQNATHLISRETGRYTMTIVGYFHQYIEWVKTSLALEVAPCKPFSNMVDTAEIITCSFLVDSMNTFWMGLGCSTLFLLPSIILAVKLAKFYRRMETEDVYDE
ncbi:prominin-1-A [Pleuronectes platessa]|uniref:prominin-1-A n=1 Tax=Pleuronectes platessa TaxID=8262 RepID=UPI00232A2A8C|nr:prominin-1-A [Pleuronectes platessa]